MLTNVRSVRPVALTDSPRENARIEALGATAAHVEWAISALQCGETDRALEYLAKAQRAMMHVVPSAVMGGTDLYIPGVPVRSVA
ncbi:hypothetical protein [Novosphingobium sp. MMS21-SN21R]|uniref:hypothetical protein n=1 Tax=Novosphingobium sp. MMS21-SN21R TaxID=2969298 RepID=UPI002883A586|nr:hypothetical protein [Novosphingobium sp. MMS21-SN21R]MDT0507508.1 hypothetical protein [Novosphingobium sp. MMS21-SN21R]